MQFPQARILIFAKAPEPGKVKTRLIPALGVEGATRVYRHLLERTLARCAAANLCPLELWVSPDLDQPLWQEYVREYAVSLHRQPGQDLGARMGSALKAALGRASQAVIIGTDIPGFSADHLAQTLAWLDQGLDAVLGPVEDGGYWLLGLRHYAGEVFADIPWSTDRVLELSRRRLAALGWRWRELEPLWDLDRLEDLRRWALEDEFQYRLAAEVGQHQHQDPAQGPGDRRATPPAELETPPEQGAEHQPGSDGQDGLVGEVLGEHILQEHQPAPQGKRQ